MLNILSFHYAIIQKDLDMALVFTYEALFICKHLEQKIVEEGNWRDLDYVVQTNFLSFYIYWKLGNIKESTKYLLESKKYIVKIVNKDY